MTPPDTLAYLLLGLAAVGLVLGFLVVSMMLRYRSLDRDMQLLDELRDDTQQTP